MIISSSYPSIQMISMMRLMIALMKDQKLQDTFCRNLTSLGHFLRIKEKFSSYRKIWQEINCKSNQL